MVLPVKTITEHAHNLYRMSSNPDEKDFIISHWPITRTIAMNDYTKPHLTFIVRGYMIQERGYAYLSVV